MIVNCINCGKEFSKKTYQVKITKNNYCSTKCTGEALVKRNNESFKSKCLTRGKCIEWSLCKNAQGYGVARYNGKNMLAHRVAYLIEHGSIGGLNIRQSCGNHACVKIDHLYAEQV